MKQITIIEIAPPGLTIPEAAKFCGYRSAQHFGKIYDKPKNEGGLDIIKHVRFYKLPGNKGYRLDLEDLTTWYRSHQVN